MTKQDKVAKVMHEWKNGRLFSNGKKVTDYDQAIAIALSEAGLSKYAEGGGIGFIPMDLHEELTHIAKFGGVKSEKDVIGILNAIVDSGLTDKDLETKPTRTATQYELVLDKKTEEVWAKIKSNYEGDLKGNQYFSSLYEIIKRNNSNDAKLIERYKPFRKLSKEEELMERGGMHSKGGNVIERRYVNKDEDYETRYAKNKPSRTGYNDERMFAVGGGVESLLEQRKELLEELINSDIIDEEHGYYDDVKGAIQSNDSEQMREIIDELLSSGLIYKDDWDYKLARKLSKEDKFAVGGEIGNTVSFKGDYGTPRSGVVKEKRGSSYIVATDDGDRLVDSYEVISFSETPIAKKKRFGFFEGGGSVESKKQAILDFINSFPDKPKDWSEATDDLPELHHDIADEYGSKYDFDFNKRSSLRDRNLRHKQHAKSLLNKLSDEEIDNIYSKWEETLEDKFEGGGEIQSKIEKLKKVVSSKMLPESVKAKAQAEIDKLEKELHESKESKAEEKAEHKASGSEYKSKLEKDLEKELHSLQRDLNSSRLQTYIEGDNSEEEKARQRERTSKIIRMNEVLSLLNEIEIGKENKMTGESEGERNVGMDKPEDYIEAKVKNLEASLKDKTISETQRKRDEKELALFKGDKKPTTRKAPVKKAVAKKVVAKKVVAKKEIEAPAKPKADHKKLVAKLKAKKGGKEYDNRASVNAKTGERYKRSESSDKKREALPLGKRVSADGNVYYERRLNRGDVSKEDKFEDGGEIKGSDWGLNLNW